MTCNNCIHEDICIWHGHMEKFESEIRDKERLLENKCFHAEIRCDNFSKKNTVNIR